MQREKLIRRIADTNKVWDMIVIGGGATGLGVTLDGALRGYQVAMFEQHDFAKYTSSRSTKLVHGGVRYLKRGDVALVREASVERGRLRRNAPHLVRNMSFVIPNYTRFEVFLYTIGLSLYDIISWGKLRLGRSAPISTRLTMKYLPTVKKEGLRGGVVYHDGQFDDSRLAINLAQSCIEQGACPVNYMRVIGILHDEKGLVSGVEVKDMETEKVYQIKSKCVVNATGVSVDDIIRMDVPSKRRMVQPSQGVHLVLDNIFLQSNRALMIPDAANGRVLFAVPWHDKVILGTSDIVSDNYEIEPVPLDEDIDFILETAGKYLTPKPERKDVLSMFAGQRPIAAPIKEGETSKEISRSHRIFVTEHNLITVTGGRWTTYRRMSEDTVNKAIKLNLLPKRLCKSRTFKIHGYKLNPDVSSHLYVYGSDKPAIKKMIDNESMMAALIHPDYKYTVAEIIWAARKEMARTVEDVLSRRVRLLIVDARAAIEAAPVVAQIMADELGYNQVWIDGQIEAFNKIAQKYLPRV
ncbi:MAG: glycerol-3-phosphate dehydrogenase/oxidase [Paludibacter sp.]|nr:glycerol-3-phosphate dehydrogenase/oxidase [Paludibacter sp.]